MTMMHSFRKDDNHPCYGDMGGPIMFVSKFTGSDGRLKTGYEILGILGEVSTEISDCVIHEGDMRTFFSPRVDTAVTSEWLNKQLSCVQDCGTVDQKKVFWSTHRMVIKGNPIFIPANQSIASRTGAIRLLVHPDGALEAFCKDDGRTVWKKEAPSNRPRVFAMGVWKYPYNRVFFGSIPRDERYFKGNGLSISQAYRVRATEVPKIPLSQEESEGIGTFAPPNGNINGSAVLTLRDDGLDLGWTTDTTESERSKYTVQNLRSYNWDRCPIKFDGIGLGRE
jgi:hypothetical protein